MRKVTALTVAAFLRGDKLSMGNSRTDGKGYYLHGNKIAHRDDHGTIWVTDCGSQTETTKDRLNAIFSMGNAPWRIHSRREKWHLTDTRNWAVSNWDGSYVFSVHEARS